MHWIYKTTAIAVCLLAIVASLWYFTPTRQAVLGLAGIKDPLQAPANTPLSHIPINAQTLSGHPGIFFQDAGNLTGTLATDRFSAYQDLQAEGKIAPDSTIVTDKSQILKQVQRNLAGVGDDIEQIQDEIAGIKTALKSSSSAVPLLATETNGPTSIKAGLGLTGGGNSGEVALAVVPGEGIALINGAVTAILGANVDLASSEVVNVLPVTHGGTGLTATPGAGQILMGNGTGYQLTNLAAGAGIGLGNSAGTLTFSNTGVTALSGTNNQIATSTSTGSIVLSLPQDIASSSSPSFSHLHLTGPTDQLSLGQGTINWSATTNRTITFPDDSGTVCLTSGNCAGSGSGIVGSGAIGQIAFFTDGNNITSNSGLAWNNTTQTLTAANVNIAGAYLVNGSPITTTNVAEGDGLYYTDARFDARLATKSTSNVAEGSNLYFTQGRFDVAFGNKTTDNLTEGNTNLYLTQSRISANTDVAANTAARHTAATVADSATLDLTIVGQQISGSVIQSGVKTSLITNDAGFVANLSGFTTDDLAEGMTHNYFSDALFAASLATRSTSNLAEGANLYYTQARFDSAFGNKTTDGLAEGNNNWYFTNSRFTTAWSTKTTSDLSEGTNLYYTDARFDARLALKTTDSLTQGSTNLYSQWQTLAGGVNFAGGKVGIGTPTPGATLDVTGSGAFSGGLTAATINGLTITNNGTNTLSLAAGKTLTVANSLSLTGTDGDSFIFPAGGGTLCVTTSGCNSSGTVSGSGSAGQLAFFNGTNSLSSDGGLAWNNSTKTLSVTGTIVMSGDIVPDTTITRSLGSPTVYWKDVYIGPGSLYINGKKVLEEQSNSIVVGADPNQNLSLQTSGSGDVELNATGAGLIQLKSNVQLTAGKTITSSDGSALTFSNGVTAGNLTMAGNTITATNTNGGISFTPIGSGGSYFTAGNVGIGNTNPGAKLDVSGTFKASGGVTLANYATNGGLLYTDASGAIGQTAAGGSGNCLQSAGGGAPTWGSCAPANSITGSGATGQIAFFNGANTQSSDSGLTWDNSGKVLSSTGSISIPTQAVGGPTARITVGNYGTISETAGGLAYITGNGITASKLANNQVTKTTSDAAQFIRMRYDTGISFHTNLLGASGTAFADDANTRLLIDLSGNVGIGTTSPKNKLDVAGGLALGSYAGVTAAPANGLIVSGNVGVGKNSASVALDVNGAGAFSGAVTAVSLNGLTITNNGSNVLNIAAGKTLAINNSLTLSGADGDSFTLPSGGGTLCITTSGCNAANTLTGTGVSGQLAVFNGANSQTGSGGLTWNGNQVDISGTTNPGFRVFNQGSNGWYFYNGAGAVGNFGMYDMTANKDRLVIKADGTIDLGNEYNLPFVRITNTGSVGIGTSAPKNKLDVNGGLALGNYAGVSTVPTNGLLVSGRVGIGTDTPLVMLDVAGDGSFSGGLAATLFNGLTITNNGTNTLNIAAGKTLTVNNSIGLSGIDGKIFNIGTNNLTFTTSADTTLTLPNSGTLLSGSATSGQVAYYNGTSTLTGSSAFTFNGTSLLLNNSSSALSVKGSTFYDSAYLTGNALTFNMSQRSGWSLTASSGARSQIRFGYDDSWGNNCPSQSQLVLDHDNYSSQLSFCNTSGTGGPHAVFRDNSTTVNRAELYSNAGIQLTATNDVTIAGTSNLIIAGGNLGIGTSTPGRALEVAGSASINGLLLTQSDSNTIIGRTQLSQNQFSLDSANAGKQWTQTGGTTTGWTWTAVSADGKYQTGTTNNGKIYTSSDYGATWTARDSNRAWRSVTMSANGKYQTAIIWPGNIYTSSDYGATWTARDSSRNWNSVAVSSDGKYQSATVYGGNIYTSSDYGVTWTARDSSRNWGGVAMSSSGKYQMSAAGQVYESTDYGVTWTATGTSQGWYVVAMSADGKFQAAGADNYCGGSCNSYFSTSSDYGATWTAKTLPMLPDSLGMSADGQTLTMTDLEYGSGSVSTDFGATWTGSSPGSPTDYYYSYNIAVSADGKYLLASNSNHLYVSIESSVLPNGNLVINNGNIGVGVAMAGRQLDIAGLGSVDNLLIGQVDSGTVLGRSLIRQTALTVDASTTGASWIARDSNRDWRAVASSADGKYQTAAVYAGTLYTSSDYGATWTSVATSQNWNTIAMSADGKFQTAGINSGYLYVSSDYGTTWTQRASSATWSALSMSADGKYQSGVTSNGYQYTSSDYGVSWVFGYYTSSPWNNSGIAISSDGKFTTITTYGGKIFTSSSYTSTSSSAWTQRDANRNWQGVAMSADAKYQTAIVNGGQVYISSDFGATWTAKDSARAWKSVAMTADGKNQAATVSSGAIYISIDYGNTWTAKDTNRAWTGIAMSSDGKYQTAAVSGGTLFTSVADSTLPGGGLTATTFNGLSIANNGGSALNIASGKTLAVTNSLTLIGTDGTAFTFPSTSGTVCVVEAANCGGVAANSLDFAQLKDALTLDASTSIALGANSLSTSGTGGITFGHTGNTTFAGKVGLGNTSPAYLLDLATANAENQADSIRLNPSNGPNGGGGTNYGGGLVFAPNYSGYSKRSAGILATAENNYFRSGLAFFTNGTADSSTDWSERMRITSTGNVGIGTSNPSAMLQVNGDGAFSSGLTAASFNGLTITTTTGGLSITAGKTLTVSNSLALTGTDGTSFALPGASSTICTQATGCGGISGSGAANQVAFWNGTSSQTGDAALYWDNTNKYLGVNTATPGRALDVVGAGSIGNLLVAQIDGGAVLGKTLIGQNPLKLDEAMIGTTWTTRDTTRNWDGVAMSADGKYQAAGTPGNYVYVSTNYGYTWTQKSNNGRWDKIAMSADGKYQAGAGSGNFLTVSSDYGSTWVTRDSIRFWSAIAMSADGKYMTAGNGLTTGQIYTSSNFGVTWTPRDSNRNWTGIAISSDGKYQTAGVNGGQIYVSTNYGITWTAKDSSRSWKGVAMSTDGKYQTASVSGGQIYISSDYGITWTAKDSSRSWTDVVMTSDGKYQTALADKVYTSSDYGQTWTARDSTRTWHSVAMSSDGKYQLASDYGGYLYESIANSTLPGGDLAMNNGSLIWTGIAAPGLSASGTAKTYFDASSNTLKLSENGGAYSDILSAGRAIQSPLATKTSAYTITGADSIILADTSGGTFTVTLPSAVGIAGKQFTIKQQTASNFATVGTTSSQTIDGSTTFTFSAQYQTITIASDGTNWAIISKN